MVQGRQGAGWGLVVASALLVAGCGTDAEETSAETVGGGGAAGADAGDGGDVRPTCGTTTVYDPLARTLQAFPDDYWSVDDAASATGMRVHLVDGDNMVLPASNKPFAKIFEDLSSLDGFGVNAAAQIMFSAKLDDASLPASGAGSGDPHASVVLVDLDASPIAFLDVEVAQVADRQDDPQTTVLVTPMLPLEPTHRHALAFTSKVKDAQGGCVAPSPAMASLLDATATDAKLTRLAPRYAELVAKLTAAGTITSARDLVAATVFTTQHTVDASVAVATDIRTHTHAYTPSGPCADTGPSVPYLTCTGTFDAADYRVAGDYLDESKLVPQVQYALPVVAYVPKTGTPPYRTIVYGHGLGGDKTQGARLADFAAPKGWATVAVDAVEHGEHPNNHEYPLPGVGGDTLNRAMNFFAVSPAGSLIDGRKLRDNWRQSTYDRLQLVELLRGGVDVTGDGTADLGIDSLTYLGVSLGGIMSAEFVALAPEVKVAVPIVPGARVTSIISDGKQFAIVITLFKGSATQGEIARFFPLLQTIVDPGDAGSYTRHMVADRLAGFDQARPQVLQQMVIEDEIVPNSTNRYFARGLGVPHVGDELQKLGIVPHEPKLPISKNLDATHTGGVFQFDLVLKDDGVTTEKASHNNIGDSSVAIEQSLHFVDSYFADGVSEILDPYRTLGVKP